MALNRGPEPEKKAASAKTAPPPGTSAATRHALHTGPVEDRATLTQARSMLILLLATCKQTQVALEAAANALDTSLRDDLSAMIERTEGELAALNAKIEALPN
jgi:hypothetical protein